MPRQYPPHFRQEMVDRMMAGETVLALVAETGVPEQTLHRWKLQARVDAGRPTVLTRASMLNFGRRGNASKRWKKSSN